MPWHTEKRGKYTVVVNSDTGKVKSRHATLAKAKACIRAMYANYNKKK
jgi:hypothetical protein